VNVRRIAGHGVSIAGAVLLAWLLWDLGRAYVRVGLLHLAPSAFHASAIWGLVLLASFCGFGAALDALFRPQRADWGLRCAWGWGVAVAGGGLLCALGLARAPVLVGFAGVGVVLLGIDRVLQYRRWQRRSLAARARGARAALGRWPFAVGVAAIGVLAAGLYLASILNTDFNGNDDKLCYFAFAREILARGTLSQPFSMRRLQAYGGKSVLDAFQLAIPVPTAHIHLVDGGMATLAVLALLAGHVRASRRTSRIVVLLLLLLTVTMPDIRFNTASTMTGVVFFLGLYRTLARCPPEAMTTWRQAVPVAVLAAGACVLRQNYLVPVGVFLALEYGRPLVRSLRLRPPSIDRAALARTGEAAGLLCVLLVPWCAMSQRWVGTFLFPLVNGHFNPEYALFEPLKPFDELRYIWTNAAYCLPLKAVPLLLIAAIGRPWQGRRSTAGPFALAAFAGFAVLLRAFPDSDPPNMGRYYFGFTFPALLAIALETATRARRSAAEGVAALSLVVAGLALQIYGDREATSATFEKLLTQLQPAFEQPAPWVPPPPDDTYRKLQDAIPAGEPIAVLVDEPWTFDFGRNPIESLDLVGAISPPPRLPLEKGGDAVASYLVGLGYRYAIVVHPDAAVYLYRRDTWRGLAPTALRLWQHTAHYYLEAFDDFDSLRGSRIHMADVGSMTALDLTQRSP
jgi:hypothetical protein